MYQQVSVLAGEIKVWSDQSEDATLVAAALDGHRKAFTVLVKRHHPKLTASDVTFTNPAGATDSSDTAYQYFVRTTQAALAKTLGHALVLPTYVPSGFALAEVSYAADPDNGSADYCGGYDRHVTSFTYRKGVAAFLISTRDAASRLDCDPYSAKRESVFSVKTTKLSSGSFAGVEARVGYYQSDPRLFAIGKRDELSVVGDLSMDEMTKVANSMQPQPS